MRFEIETEAVAQLAEIAASLKQIEGLAEKEESETGIAATLKRIADKR